MPPLHHPQPWRQRALAHLRAGSPGARRGAARAIAAAALLLAALGGLALSWHGATAAPPDVLIVVLDTVRADHVSAISYGRPTTPALERFAAEALVFEDAWGPSSWTLPAHAALFSGMHPSEVGLGEGSEVTIKTDTPLMAERLRRAGWATACFTANAWVAPHTGATRGFERVDEMYAEEGGTWAARNHDRALDWMRARRRSGQRFFAFVNDMEAHAPWNPSPDARRRFLSPERSPAVVQRLSTHSILDAPDGGLLFDPEFPGVRETASDLYDGEVADLDTALGRLLGTMRAEGMLDDTLVIVVSDHGEGLGDHLWMEHGFSLHREILHVPLVIRLPGGRDARRVKDVVRLEDVLPTVLEVCGLERPEGLRGASLLGPTEGRVAVGRMRIPAAFVPRTEEVLGPRRAALARRKRWSVYDGRWHLLEDDSGVSELFDVQADPEELHDVAHQHPEEVTRLRALQRDGRN